MHVGKRHTIPILDTGIKSPTWPLYAHFRLILGPMPVHWPNDRHAPNIKVEHRWAASRAGPHCLPLFAQLPSKLSWGFRREYWQCRAFPYLPPHRPSPPAESEKKRLRSARIISRDSRDFGSVALVRIVRIFRAFLETNIGIESQVSSWFR